MTSVVVFSKDRPLQLHACLESLLHRSDIDPGHVHVLFKETKLNSYAAYDAFSNAMWTKETDFFLDLRCIVEEWEKESEYILLVCDDTVFKAPFTMQQIEQCFAEDPLLFGFSLRYGRNLDGWDKLLREHYIRFRVPFGSIATIDDFACEDAIITFDRVTTQAYPCDVSASVFRRQDLLDMLSMDVTIDNHAIQTYNLPSKFKAGSRHPVSELMTGPNMLESVMHYWHSKELPRLLGLTHLACYGLSRSVSFSANRVQDVAPNVCSNKPWATPEAMYKAYTEGKRLDWRALERWANKYTHDTHLERFVVK